MANASSGSFWSSVPGMLSGAAALLTAIGGLIALRPRPDGPIPLHSAECDIKGNISQTPEGTRKLYHLPQDNGYQATHIDTTEGERWFCSEVEAQQAGWRRAQQQ